MGRKHSNPGRVVFLGICSFANLFPLASCPPSHNNYKLGWYQLACASSKIYKASQLQGSFFFLPKLHQRAAENPEESAICPLPPTWAYINQQFVSVVLIEEERVMQ